MSATVNGKVFSEKLGTSWLLLSFLDSWYRYSCGIKIHQSLYLCGTHRSWLVVSTQPKNIRQFGSQSLLVTRAKDFLKNV
jgi:hypothetical protein